MATTFPAVLAALNDDLRVADDAVDALQRLDAPPSYAPHLVCAVMSPFLDTACSSWGCTPASQATASPREGSSGSSNGPSTAITDGRSSSTVALSGILSPLPDDVPFVGAHRPSMSLESLSRPRGVEELDGLSPQPLMRESHLNHTQQRPTSSEPPVVDDRRIETRTSATGLDPSSLSPPPLARPPFFEHLLSGSAGRRSSPLRGADISSSSEDEVLGVTSDGELLFRPRRELRHHHSDESPDLPSPQAAPLRVLESSPPPGSSLFPVRPTPHRTQTMGAARQEGTAARTGGEVSRSKVVFATCPIPITAEDIRFTQLALRLRDRENDIYSEHVREELQQWATVQAQQHQYELASRFDDMQWDLRRL